jgi:hypothetical protein
LTNSQPNDGNSEEQRRRNPRFPFVAKAEVCETSTGEWINAQVSEISLNGCYLDMMNPLPVGTQVLVKIFENGEFFEATAKVAYSHPNLGMGLTYCDVKANFLATLQKWLLEALRTTNRMNQKS